jgi:hypothetical protein
MNSSIDLTGYERVAQCVTDDGAVVLVHNNSTHYIVASCFLLSDPFEHLPRSGTVLSTFEYAQGTTTAAFAAALDAFKRAVLQRSTSLDDDY